MKIAIDIDGVIDRIPEFLSIITPHLLKKGVSVTILSSREKSEEVIRKSLEEIKSYNIKYSDFFFLPLPADDDESIPKELNWHERHIYGKAKYCLDNNIDLFFEDDQKTVNLIEHYASKTICLKVT